jgi:hypothetical protein
MDYSSATSFEGGLATFTVNAIGSGIVDLIAKTDGDGSETEDPCVVTISDK